MPPTAATVAFLNFGHALDHLLMLIFPTVVLAMTHELGMAYSELLPLSLGGFIAFGACSLPAGWLGDRWDRHGMMTLFFVGAGAAAILTGLARSTTEIAVGLTLIGVFAAIYHPVGIAILVRRHPRMGRALGVNGFFGNAGVAAAALTAGALADLAGWRAAFIVPGAVSVIAGVLFWFLVPRAAAEAAVKKAGVPVPRAVVARAFAVIFVATVCGGLIFNSTVVAMPKIFDERLSALTNTTFGIGALVALVYLLAAVAQLIVGTLLDKGTLRAVFLPVAALQAPLLLLAGSAQDYMMLAVAVAMMFVVFGQIPINDAMVARYTDDAWRSRVYAVRYVVSFGASAAAVPLIAFLHRGAGGFESLFAVLAAVAVPIFLGALFFPKPSPAGGRPSPAAA